jgi:hypothetical protein
MLIHAFLSDPAFFNSASVLDPVRKTGGICVPSAPSLSYFVAPQEFTDPRLTRASNLNVTMLSKASLIIDQTPYAQTLTDIQTIWTTTERTNLFSIIDQLCFGYQVSALPAAVELSLAPWPQYLANSAVFSTTYTAATVYNPSQQVSITCPDYVSFTFVIGNGTQYQFRIWLNNALFYTGYPLSFIGAVVPPLPVSELYTLSITSSTDSVFHTAATSSQTSQQELQNYIASTQYSGYVAYGVTFMDGSGNTTLVPFNLLYNGAVPGAIAIRTAIRQFLVGSGVGTSGGWQALAPSLFVTELFYLLPMFEATTSRVNVVVQRNITPIQLALTDANAALHDLPSGTITAYLELLTSFYNSTVVLSVPAPENMSNRMSLVGEHPSYQDVATTDPAFGEMEQKTQSFATLLAGAISAALGNPITNSGLVSYTPPNDTRTYITFTIGDVTYYVITKASYLALVTP